MPSPAAVLGGLLAGALVVGGAVTVVATNGEPPTSVSAEVVKVVDGDTIDVRYDGDVRRVRLLNVDTPEKDECLSHEATEFLRDRLPSGVEVQLEFDQFRIDVYDRELAGVIRADRLINAEIAEQGLGVPLLIEPNDRFYADVVEANKRAKQRQIGLYAPEVGCTIPGQVEGLTWSGATEDVDAEGATAYVSEIHERIGAGEALLTLLAGEAGSLQVAGLAPAEVQTLRSTVTEKLANLEQQRTKWSDRAEALAKEEAAARKAEKERKAAEKAKREAEAKAKAEAEAKAKQQAEEQAQREAEAKAEAERQAEAQREAEAEAQRQRERERENNRPAPAPAPPPAPPPTPAPPPPSSGSGGGGLPGAGYTGCRAYIGGPYIDDQGRHYTPIDCTTKQPLVP